MDYSSESDRSYDGNDDEIASESECGSYSHCESSENDEESYELMDVIDQESDDSPSGAINDGYELEIECVPFSHCGGESDDDDDDVIAYELMEVINQDSSNNNNINDDSELQDHDYSLVLGGSSTNEINAAYELFTNNIDALVDYEPIFDEHSVVKKTTPYQYSELCDPFFGVMTYDPEIAVSQIGKVSISR